jgi:hypothetical protein
MRWSGAAAGGSSRDERRVEWKASTKVAATIVNSMPPATRRSLIRHAAQ